MPVRFANAYCIALASARSDYRSVLEGTGINFPDGMPVSWVMRMHSKDELTRQQVNRIRGYDFFIRAMEMGVGQQIRHFLLGATPAVLDAMTLNLTRRVPGVKIVGSFAPPYVPDTDSWAVEAHQRIAATSPDIVWVGLGTPKQDFAAVRLADMTGKPAVGVGAAFDFAAGTVKQAPLWMQRTGVEWLYRLASEPRRLWRRYLIGNLQFLRAILMRR